MSKTPCGKRRKEKRSRRVEFMVGAIGFEPLTKGVKEGLCPSLKISIPLPLIKGKGIKGIGPPNKTYRHSGVYMLLLLRG